MHGSLSSFVNVIIIVLSFCNVQKIILCLKVIHKLTVSTWRLPKYANMYFHLLVSTLSDLMYFYSNLKIEQPVYRLIKQREM